MTAPVKAQPTKASKQPVMRRPFVTGTRRVDRATYDQTRTQTTGTQVLNTYEADPNGFLGGFYVLVECTTAANAAAVAFQPNAPFSAIQSITFSDTNNKPLVGPMSGWDLYIATKYGGYAHQDDAKASAVFFATTGAGATGGSFRFLLRVPVEIVKRDALGALPNKNASATFDVSITLAASTDVYTVSPTSLGSIRTRIQQFGWMDTNATDFMGNPVQQNPIAVQTTAYIQKQTYTLSAGAFSQRLQGIDSLLRGLTFMWDAAGVRSTGEVDAPDPFTLQYEQSQPINRLKAVWRHMLTEMYGYTGGQGAATSITEAANTQDNGVFHEPYNLDWNLKPGGESRFGYLPASAATNLTVQGTIGGSGLHTLGVLVNKVVPYPDAKALTGR